MVDKFANLLSMFDREVMLFGFQNLSEKRF